MGQLHSHCQLLLEGREENVIKDAYNQSYKIAMRFYRNESPHKSLNRTHQWLTCTRARASSSPPGIGESH